MAAERRRVHYTGRVQGVGFRFTAQRVAAGYAVTGYVRNLPDGRVELLADGEPGALEAFLDAVRSEMKTKVRDASVSKEDISPPLFPDFSIHY